MSDTTANSEPAAELPVESKPPAPSPATPRESGSHSLMFGIVGVFVALGIVIVVNYISPVVPGRIDFTENKRHTLSDGTKAILEKLDTEVQIKFYISQGEEKVPSTYLNRVREIEAILDEYDRVSDFVTVNKIDPQPDTREEDDARLAGIARTQFSDRSEAYFGIAVSCLDQTTALPAIAGIREEQFEYNLTRTITQVYNPKKKVLGLMTSLQMQGMPFAGQQGWVFYDQLSQDFEVKTVSPSAEEIEDDVDILLIVHPGGITDKAQYAIDQFIVSGKNVVAFLDPFSLAAANTRPPQGMPGQPPIPPETSSSLPVLLEKWGLNFDASQVVADRTYVAPEFGNNPIALKLNRESLNRDDVVTQELTSLLFVTTGGFTVAKIADGLTMEVLAETSDANSMVEPRSAMQDPEKVLADFTSSGRKKTLALRLSGTFSSAFPDGAPKDPADDDDGDDDDDDDTVDPEAKDGDSDGHKGAADGPSAVYLVADTDLLSDQFAMDRRFRMALGNHNIPLGLNILEQAAGDTALISIRSRASSNRPFTKINKIEEAADSRVRDRIRQLQERQQEIGQQTLQLKQGPDGNLQLVMSEEDRAKLASLKEEEAEALREIRDLKIDAKKEVTSHLNWIKWRNILGMPFVIAIVGVVVSVMRKIKTAAR